MKNIYVIALAAILLQGCGQKKETTAPATRPVKTTIVESRSVIRKDFSGIVEAVEYVKLAFRVSGQIINLPVIEGEKVKKGQLIAASTNPREYRVCSTLPPSLPTKRLPHKWNATSGCSPGKRSPCRNMKSAFPTIRKRNRSTNCPPTICVTPN